jgi:RNA polymerase sigma factor (sigma-70 family)
MAIIHEINYLMSCKIRRAEHFALNSLDDNLPLNSRDHRLKSPDLTYFLRQIKDIEKRSATRLSIRDETTLIKYFKFLSAKANYETETSDYRNLVEYIKRVIIKANIRGIQYVANQYFTHHLSTDDLVQEGTTGLLRALDKFEFGFNVKFYTYAYFWIKQAISRAVTRATMIKYPTFVAQKLKRTNSKITNWEIVSLDTDLRDLFTEKQLDSKFKITQYCTCETFSSDYCVFDDCPYNKKYTLNEVLGDVRALDDIERIEAQAVLSKAIVKLNEEERFIVFSRFGLYGYRQSTLQDIGDVLGITRERVRQIELQAKSKLKVLIDYDR